MTGEVGGGRNQFEQSAIVSGLTIAPSGGGERYACTIVSKMLKMPKFKLLIIVLGLDELLKLGFDEKYRGTSPTILNRSRYSPHVKIKLRYLSDGTTPRHTLLSSIRHNLVWSVLNYMNPSGTGTVLG
jgi:hypothetical protein